MTIAILIIIAVVLVLVLGLFLFWLMRRGQTEVPQALDAKAGGTPQIVGTDEQGRPITDADESPVAPRDETAFDSLLQDEIHDLGMEQPPAGDEP